MILVIDNYDSFVHNLARYFRQLGQEVLVRRNDAVSIDEIRGMKPQAIVLSPGPCTPTESGICLEVVRQLQTEVPILGVCLGHQAIVEALGGRVVRSHRPMHGQASPITHDGHGAFRELPSPMHVGRYHSLIAERESLPSCLRIDAQTEDGTIMAVSHETLPVVGVQFHPESVLTEHGYAMLANFLHVAGIDATVRVDIAMPKIAVPGSGSLAEGNVYWSQGS
ncbi:aminodeoxychorismate/anthranilate synthase component II [Bremerella sp. JC770]|uniref:anthranilate synthase component II n=1 Tax=Bremerella sp. JC770 TaxID=3232137 RepID=UPI00345A0C67